MFSFARGSAVQDAQKAFRELDANGDGRLSLNELHTAAERLRGSKAPAKARIEHILSKFDADKNGTLDLAEFQKLCAYLDRGHAVQEELASVYDLVTETKNENERLKALLKAAQPSKGGAIVTPPPAAPSTSLPAAAGTPPPSPISSTTAAVVSAAVASARQAVVAEGGSNWDEGGAGGYGDDAGPGGFLVTGAGSEEVNGFYKREGDYGGAPLFTKEKWWLLRYTMKSGNSWWYIADKGNLDKDDGDMYRVRHDGKLPPTNKDWLKAKDGVLPAPTFHAQDSPGEEAVWRAADWLSSLGTHELLADVLLGTLPRGSSVASSQTRRASARLELPFLRALGKSGSQQARRRHAAETRHAPRPAPPFLGPTGPDAYAARIATPACSDHGCHATPRFVLTARSSLRAQSVLELLQASPLLERLAAELWDGLVELSAARAASGQELHDKFCQDGGAFTLSCAAASSHRRILPAIRGCPCRRVPFRMHARVRGVHVCSHAALPSAWRQVRRPVYLLRRPLGAHRRAVARAARGDGAGALRFGRQVLLPLPSTPLCSVIQVVPPLPVGADDPPSLSVRQRRAVPRGKLPDRHDVAARVVVRGGPRGGAPPGAARP